MGLGAMIYVCGISGVGKTHLIRSVLPHFPQALAWRASEIIGEARNTADAEYLRQLPVDEIHRSQLLLVKGYAAREQQRAGRVVLLDAHTVIDTEAGFFDIGLDVVTKLSPNTFVHVEDSVERIHARRDSDAKRTRPARTVAELSLYQQRSLMLCTEFAQALNRPLHRIASGEDSRLREIMGGLPS